jgi:hypothetical protein
MSRFPAWHFRSMDPGEVHVDPVHDEFFKMQDLADALVRESIQNSLDARRGRSPVKVRFRFCAGNEALDAESARDYFAGLREHLNEVASSIHSLIPREDEPVPYLLIEDFGTRGLTGDPGIDPELQSDDDTKNDFYYFWRNVGRSNKSETDRGRWGLGKAVFSVASRIRTIFGLTRRADDSRALLLGQSVLRTHILGGVRACPYGFFARFEKRNGLPLPIEDPLVLERFADDFRLIRTEPGLSIVVPHFRSDELSLERILESAIRQYFYPISRGDLTVEAGDAVRTETISARSIDDVARRYDADSASDIAKLTALTRWSLTEASDVRVELADLPPERAPKWSDDLLPESVLDDLRGCFERGERIAVRAKLLVKRKRSKPAMAHFDVFLERDDALRKPVVHFIRRGITIPDVKSTTSSDKTVRALVVIDHEALSTFLGDAENPAHSDWSERADKLRALYDHHAGTLRFVKNSAAFLASVLSRPPQGRVRDFLQDIFSIEMPDEEEAARAKPRIPIRGTEKGETEGPGAGAASGRAARVTITRVTGGFTIKGAGDEALVARPMIAEVAYRRRNGNPFRKHSPFDFDLSRNEVAIITEGASVSRSAANTLEFIPMSPKFQITLKGFDPRRDLVVRVAAAEEHAPEAELH